MECDRPAEPAPHTPFARVIKKLKIILFFLVSLLSSSSIMLLYSHGRRIRVVPSTRGHWTSSGVLFISYVYIVLYIINIIYILCIDVGTRYLQTVLRYCNRTTPPLHIIILYRVIRLTGYTNFASTFLCSGKKFLYRSYNNVIAFYKHKKINFVIF